MRHGFPFWFSNLCRRCTTRASNCDRRRLKNRRGDRGPAVIAGCSNPAYKFASIECQRSGAKRKRLSRECKSATIGCCTVGKRRICSGRQRYRRSRRGSDLSRKLRHRTRLHQRSANAVAYEVMDEGLLSKADLSLRGMHIRVHLCRRHLQEQQHHGEDRRRNDVAIRLSKGMLYQAIAHQAMVHENKNGIAVQFLQLRLRHKSMQPHFPGRGWFILSRSAPGRGFGNASPFQIGFGS